MAPSRSAIPSKRRARLATTALGQLERAGARYALATMGIGVGQGIALVIERV